MSDKKTTTEASDSTPEEVIRSAIKQAETDGRRRGKNSDPSAEFIEAVCQIYGDYYDDREEDSSIGGEDWVPGQKANHQSLSAFQEELEEKYDIHLSTGKIRKILISGGRWSTERSREVAELFEEFGSVRKVAEELGLSESLVKLYLPYGKVVYDLEGKSSNAKRIGKCRERKRGAAEG